MEPIRVLIYQANDSNAKPMAPLCAESSEGQRLDAWTLGRFLGRERIEKESYRKRVSV